jgi:hypothetical protein
MTLPSRPPPADETLLGSVQRAAYNYFLHETNPLNGLVVDRTAPNWPASIAAVGFGLASHPVGVERGWIRRAAAVDLTLATLRFLRSSTQGVSPDATGHRGFYYHFLDMQTGARAWKCELSTMDTALLLAGMLTAAAYFDGSSAPEREIRALADELYARVDWTWAFDGGPTLSQGWMPDRGFLRSRWTGYNEGMVLYLLGLGSPTHPLPVESYPAWTSTYRWKRLYGVDHLFAGPLFIHQMSYCWIDSRGIRDEFMRSHDVDYFENSRRATRVHQAYAMRNPGGFAQYGEHCWGLSASDGPGATVRQIGGRTRRFFDYVARGAPFGPDDGTVAPWAAVASLPFAPEIVLPTIEALTRRPRLGHPRYGFRATFNPTFPDPGGSSDGWVSPYHYGINQGPIVLMIENHRSALIWELMRASPYLVTGLRRAGFAGGWLSREAPHHGH